MKLISKKHILFFIISALIFCFFFFISYHNSTKLNNISDLNKSYKDNIEFITNENYFLDNHNINYTLSLNNHKVFFEIKDKNLISFIEFDDNRMVSENKDESSKIYSTTYEIIPSTYKIRIYFNNGSIDDYEISVKYFYKNGLSENFHIKENWIFSPKDKYDISNDGITLLGQYKNNQPTVMQYYKDFDKDITLKFDFEVLKDNVTDLNLSFGERLRFSFNNKRIDIYRREYSKSLKKDVWIKYNFIKDFSRLKKGVKYTIYFKRFQKDNYSIKFIDHSNELNSKNDSYIDDRKNLIEFERYKNLRISIGSEHMIILIKEIELN